MSGLRFVEPIVSFDTFFGYHGKLPRFSRLDLLLDIERRRPALNIGKFIAYTEAFLIASLVYLVSAEQLGLRFGMITSAIIATVGNRYSLDAMLGVKSTFGLVNQLSLIVFTAIYTALTVSILDHHLHRTSLPKRAERVDHLAGIATFFVFLTLAITAFVVAHG